MTRLAKSDTNVELRYAQVMWPFLSTQQTDQLLVLLERHEFSMRSGDVLLLDGKWYITHAGLLRLAHRRRCRGIQVQPVREFCDSTSKRWAFKATVFRSPRCKGFVGFGDADPTNVSSALHGAEMRIAETRAVNRALRKAYGIGTCSVEELGIRSEPVGDNVRPKKRPPQPAGNNGFASPARLRDRLCQLIRQHRLDPPLVKSYAVDFCRVKSLKEAKPEQVEAFIQHLSDWAMKDRDALLCQLNSYQLAHQQQQGAA